MAGADLQKFLVNQNPILEELATGGGIHMSNGYVAIIDYRIKGINIIGQKIYKYNLKIGEKTMKNDEKNGLNNALMFNVKYNINIITIMPPNLKYHHIGNGIFYLRTERDLFIFIKTQLYHFKVDEYVFENYTTHIFTYDEFYFKVEDSIYVFSIENIYKLKNSIAENTIVYNDYLKKKTKITQFGKYYNIKQMFLILISLGMEKPRLWLPSELWEGIYKDYFDEVYKRFE